MSGGRRWIPGAAGFFLFGAVYYFLVPYAAFRWMPDSVMVRAAAPYVGAKFFDAWYWVDCAVIGASWTAGYLLGQRLPVRAGSLADEANEEPLATRVLVLALGLFLLFQVASAVRGGASFFTGYETYDIAVLGPLSTTLFSAVLLAIFSRDRVSRIAFLLLFLVTSVLMLGFGSRLFFLLGAVSLLISRVAGNAAILRRPWLYAGLAVLVGIVVPVGLLRQGADVSWQGMADIGVAEPVFTAVSAATFLENGGGRPLLSVPVDVLASFVNFIPSVVWPSKTEVLTAMMDNPHVYSPFGASALLGNLYANFGIFYPVFLAGVGAYYGFLRRKAQGSAFFQAVYFVALPLLMFHFFRENFVTVIKVMLFNALILPWVAIRLALYLSRAVAAQPAAPGR